MQYIRDEATLLRRMRSIAEMQLDPTMRQQIACPDDEDGRGSHTNASRLPLRTQLTLCIRVIAVFVYVLRDGNWPSHIKIGCTDNLVVRIGQLRTSNPRDLKYLFIYRAVGMNAHELEQAAHHHFRGHRYLTSEWFSVRADDVVEMLLQADPSGICLLDERI